MAYDSLRMLGKAPEFDAFKSFQQGQEFVGQRQLADSLRNTPVSEPMGILAGYAPEKAFNLIRSDQMAAMDRVPDESVTKKEIRRLEQLWKDSARGYRQADYTGNEDDKLYYKDMMNKIQAELAVLDPSLWGGEGSGVAGGAVGDPTVEDNQNQTPAKDILTEYDNMVKDTEPKDGVIDNASNILYNLKQTLLDNGYNTKSAEYQSLMDWWDNKKVEVNEKYNEAKENKRYTEKQYKSDDVERRKLASARTAYDYLLQNPESTANIVSALTALLRMESGAAIAENEYVGRSSGLLPADKYDEMIREMTSLSMVIGGRIAGGAFTNANTQRIFSKYASDVDIERLKKELSNALGRYANGVEEGVEPLRKTVEVDGVKYKVELPVGKENKPENWEIIGE